jgi:pantetheine-phosphate adenylyltransferase
VEIVERGMALFDEIVVAVGVNSAKKYLFSEEERLEMLRLCFGHQPRIRVVSFNILTADLARQYNAPFVLRGLRSEQDLAYEQPISFVNHHLNPALETVFLHSNPATMHISSSIVREIVKYGGDLHGLVPDVLVDYIRAHYATKS